MPSSLWTWTKAIRDSGLEGTTRAALWALATFMDPDGSGANPSIGTIARAAGLSEKATGQHLRKAAKLGWLERYPRRTKAGFRSYEYRTALPGASRGTSQGNVVPLHGEGRSLTYRNVVLTTKNTTNINTNKNLDHDLVVARRGDDFESLWDTVPRRLGSRPESAIAIWEGLTPGDRRKALIAAASYRQDFDRRYSTEPARAKALGFVPFLPTWLKRASWRE